MEKTVGEKRVRTDFNVNGSSTVDDIKKKSAELINLIISLGKEKQDNTELGRLIALAVTGYEQSAMWAVKAATV